MELKKYKSADPMRYRPLFFCIGLCLSLLLVLTAFEWKSYGDREIAEPQVAVCEFPLIVDIPPTVQDPPPKNQVIIEIPKEEVVAEEIEIDLDIEIVEETTIEKYFKENPMEDEEVDVIVSFAEQQPEFPGGIQAFYQYVSKNFKYPSQARRMGIEGKVFVQFVIDKKGQVVDVVAIKGIGAGCDQEAVRVIESSPRWNPGKQRGVAVKVRMVLPITFKLG